MVSQPSTAAPDFLFFTVSERLVDGAPSPVFLIPTWRSHRPWRGELLEREPGCKSLHRERTHPHRLIAPWAKELRRQEWVVARRVQRLWGAGRQGAGGGLGTRNESPSMTLNRGVG